MSEPIQPQTATSNLEKLKGQYDILKWIAGIAIGIITGAFFVGVYFAKVKLFITRSVIPEHMVAYFTTGQCPEGWSRADALRGRYVVGIDPNHIEAIGTTVGNALAHAENRPAGKHTHKATNTIPVAGGGRDQMMGGGRGGFSDPAVETSAGQDSNGQPLIEGTNAPYVILSACESPKEVQ